MDVSVTVIDSNGEPLALEPEFFRGPYPLTVRHERRRGKSAALNTGIGASTADYIGLIDDDEEIAPDWFQVAERALEGRAFDFVGGPTVLRPLDEPPAWLPPGYPAVLGSAECGTEPLPYGPGFPGILMGGNAVIARAALLAAGPYSTALGPRPERRLFSSEDEDMYWRLVDGGARGQYLPGLIVYHHVHPERLRKSYYRSWCFWNGASKGVLSRRQTPSVTRVGGLPRYLYGDAARGVLTWLRGALTANPSRRMAGELPLWQLAGRIYGRHLLRDDPARSPNAWRHGAAHEPYGDDTSIIGSSTR